MILVAALAGTTNLSGAAQLPSEFGFAQVPNIRYDRTPLAPGRTVSWASGAIRLDRLPDSVFGNQDTPILFGDLYNNAGVRANGTTYGVLGINDRGVVKPFLLREVCKAVSDCPARDDVELRCLGAYDRLRQVVLKMDLTCQRTQPDGTPFAPFGTITVTLVLAPTGAAFQGRGVFTVVRS
jgi:hypothetical protein